MRLEDAVVERGDFTLGPFTLDIAWAERIALVGPNGSGKTTLVEALLGRLPLAPGTRRMGPSVVVGELAQDRRVLGGSSTLAEAFTAATGLPPDQARAQLAKFGLGADAVLRPSSSLSPGERTRAELAAFSALGVNFLVLDEPTNHLDLPAIEQLESALDDYAGRSCSSPTTGDCSRRSRRPAAWSCPAGPDPTAGCARADPDDRKRRCHGPRVQ